MTAVLTTKASFFPSLDRKVLIALALSGVAATIAFDVFGQILSRWIHRSSATPEVSEEGLGGG